MKKENIVKTIIISLLIVIVFFVSTFFIVGAVSPKIISNLAFRVNAKNLSLNYAEKAYLKDETVESLGTLIERSIYAENDEKIVKYSPVFLSSSEFDEYKKNKSGNYELYIVNEYVSSLYNLKSIEKAVNTALSYTDFNSYGETTSPIRILISTANKQKDKETLTTIRTNLDEVGNKTQDLLDDIELLNEMISRI